MGIVQVLLISHVLICFWKHSIGEYLLKSRQVLYGIGYIIAILLCFLAEFVQLNEIFGCNLVPSSLMAVPWLVATLWILAGNIFILTLNSMIKIECEYLLVNKGYVRPLPLSKTSEGWTQSGSRVYSHSILIGTIKNIQ